MARTLQHSIRQAFHMMQWANIINTLIDISPARISLRAAMEMQAIAAAVVHTYTSFVSAAAVLAHIQPN